MGCVRHCESVGFSPWLHGRRPSVRVQGNMGTKFIDDLLLDPTTRNISDIRHELVAVLSSTSRARAEEFASAFAQRTPGPVAAYASLEDLAADQNVDVVYIASPTSKHYEHAAICLKAGKAVLCEVRHLLVGTLLL
jgi:predicted dehydrogenase